MAHSPSVKVKIPSFSLFRCGVVLVSNEIHSLKVYSGDNPDFNSQKTVHDPLLNDLIKADEPQKLPEKSNGKFILENHANRQLHKKRKIQLENSILKAKDLGGENLGLYFWPFKVSLGRKICLTVQYSVLRGALGPFKETWNCRLIPALWSAP